MTKEEKIDTAEDDFHHHAAELKDALAFAHSRRCPDSKVIEAFGKAVTIARRMIAADDKLRKLGAAHESSAS